LLFHPSMDSKEVHDTLRGIEIRAAILGLVTLLIGGWILAPIIKTAGAALARILAVLFGFVLLMTGAISFKVLRAKRSRGELPA
jgi:uncharacterized membrane protein HdeD (DUF308 family)